MMGMDESKLNDMLRKVRALKAKANDKATTEAESLAFLAKATELMQQYGLEEAQLTVEEQSPIDQEQGIKGSMAWSASRSRMNLVWAVCKLYMVKAVHYRHSKTWTLIGRKHNLIMAKEMIEYLLSTVLRISNQYGKTTGGNVIDFRKGCMARLTERVSELYWEQARAAAQYKPSGNPGNLPALYSNEEDLLDKFMRAKYPNARAVRSRLIRMGFDSLAGRQAANSISLNRQVGSSKSLHLK